MGGSTYLFLISNYFRVVTSRNSFISTVLETSFPFSWNLICFCNLIDVDIRGFGKTNVCSLSCVHLILFILDKRGWSSSSSGIFLVKSFHLTLSNLLALVHFFQQNSNDNLKPHLRSRLSLG